MPTPWIAIGTTLPWLGTQTTNGVFYILEGIARYIATATIPSLLKISPDQFHRYRCLRPDPMQIPTVLDNISAIIKQLSRYSSLLNDIHRYHHKTTNSKGKVLRQKLVKLHRHGQILQYLQSFKPKWFRQHWKEFNPWNSRHLAIIDRIYQRTITELENDQAVLKKGWFRGIFSRDMANVVLKWTTVDVHHKYLGRLLLTTWKPDTRMNNNDVNKSRTWIDDFDDLEFSMAEWAEVIARIWEEEVDRGVLSENIPEDRTTNAEDVIDKREPGEEPVDNGCDEDYRGPKALRRHGDNMLVFKDRPSKPSRKKRSKNVQKVHKPLDGRKNGFAY